MLLPLSCDAPIYHWPYATIGLIVANLLAFAGAIALLLEYPESAVAMADWVVLAHGDGLHPVQWLTNMFMHAGPFHLLGNMVFLWVFGLVVEGKIGWWRFLLLYLGIGILQSALVQVAMLGVDDSSGSLGASSAIYGIMAIAVLWAPKNEISCFYFYWFFLIAVGTVDIPIMLFALLYLVFDFLFMGIEYAQSGSLMSTGFLHITGALVGAPVGLAMIKLHWVDCEGWDLLHVWNGADPNAEPDYTKIDAEVARKKEAKATQQREDARQKFREFLDEGNARGAAALYNKLHQLDVGFEIERDDYWKLIRGLHARREWELSAPLMHELIERYPDGTDSVRLKLAQICVTAIERPARALELLDTIDYSQQSSEKKALAKKIAQRAKQLQAEGVYELDDKSW